MDDQEEVSVTYTTVTVEKEKKQKPEKDFIFCIVFLCILFAVLAEGLFIIAFKSSQINIVEQQYIRQTRDVSKDLQNQYNTGKGQVEELRDVEIPQVMRMSLDTACITMQNSQPVQRIDNLQAFSGYTSRVNEAFMSYQDLTLMSTSAWDSQKQTMFLTRLLDEDGQLKVMVQPGTINPIPVWNSKVCFLARGVEIPDNKVENTTTPADAGNSTPTPNNNNSDTKKRRRLRNKKHHF